MVYLPLVKKLEVNDAEEKEPDKEITDSFEKEEDVVDNAKIELLLQEEDRE